MEVMRGQDRYFGDFFGSDLEEMTERMHEGK